MYKMYMKEYLIAMGAGDIFTDSVDLSGISDANSRNLKTSLIIHSTSFQVDQDGTMAAAVTYKEFKFPEEEWYWSYEEEPFNLLIDRPFAFMVYDKFNHLPIFVGKVGHV